MTVEHLDPLARLSRGTKSREPAQVEARTEKVVRRFAWFAVDDPVPFVVMLFWAMTQLMHKVGLQRSSWSLRRGGGLPPAGPRLLRKRRSR